MLKAIGADADSPRWLDFVARYRPVMESYLKSQYPAVEADDVMQETLVVLARRLPDYRYAPDEKGHFRNYLLGILKNKAREAIKRQMKDVRAVEAAKDFAAIAPVAAACDDAETENWRISAYEVALQQLLANPRLGEKTRQIFIRTALRGEDPASVAALFGTTRNNVDQIKNRMTAELRKLAMELADA
ncbi:MAG: sigma-70 family RNA polymerase sigma factor [Kiritimatiellia bacterium]